MNLNYSTDVLAEIWNTLNEWGWDERVGEKPKNFNNLLNYSTTSDIGTTKYDFVSPINKEIEKRIGIKECLRWNNVHNCGKTYDEFEEWWKNDRLDRL